jgi:nucleoside-diphosphate-sugar epimerase
VISLVTGGSGFLGGYLSRLEERGERVQVVTRPHNAPSALAGLPVERICGELQDLSSLICGCRESHHGSRAR